MLTPVIRMNYCSVVVCIMPGHKVAVTVEIVSLIVFKHNSTDMISYAGNIAGRVYT